MEAIRNREYAVDWDEQVVGIGMIAVSIRINGNLHGTLNIVAPTGRIRNESYQTELLEKLREVNDEITINYQYGGSRGWSGSKRKLIWEIIRIPRKHSLISVHRLSLKGKNFVLIDSIGRSHFILIIHHFRLQSRQCKGIAPGNYIYSTVISLLRGLPHRISNSEIFGRIDFKRRSTVRVRSTSGMPYW